MQRFMLIAALLLSKPAYSQGPKTITLPENRTIEIIGDIDFPLLQKANDLKKMVSDSKAPIYILINSPGGSILAMDQFIGAMKIAKAHKVQLNCVVGVIAASAAFDILTACDRRYALPTSLLLFHPPSVTLMGFYRTSDIELIYQELSKSEKKTIDNLVKVTGIPSPVFLKHFYDETLFVAPELIKIARPGFLVLVDDVIGTSNLFMVDVSGSSSSYAAQIFKNKQQP